MLTWPEIPADLSALTDEELSVLEDELVAFFSEAAPTITTAEDLARLTGITDGLDTVRTEASTRATAAQAIADGVAALATRVAPVVEGETPDGETEDPEGEGDADPEGEGEETAEPTAVVPVPIAAAAPPVEPAVARSFAERVPAPFRPRPAVTPSRVTIVAAADVPEYGGKKLNTTLDIAMAMIERHSNLAGGSGGIEDRVPVARFTYDHPEERTLSSRDSLQATADKVEKLKTKGLVAAGGLCAPTAGYYDQLVIAEAMRPVRDFLAGFGADRGGIRFNPPPKLSDITQGTGIVTAAQDGSGSTFADGVTNSTTLVTSATAAFTQADVGRTITGAGIPAGTTITAVASGTNATMSQAATATASGVSITIGRGSKATFVVTCPSIQEVVIQAIYASIQFGNFLGRSFPEQVEAWTKLMAAAQARVAETALLDLIAAKSTAVTSAGLVGAGREVIARIGQGAAAYRNRNRMDPSTMLDVMLPAWVPDLMAADFTRTFSDDAEIVAMQRADAERYLATKNVRLGWYVDSKTGGGQIFGSQGVGVLLNYPSTVVAYMYASGTFLHLDGGTLDLGLVRDSVLNSNNNFRMFTETFESVAFVGVESLEITMTLCADGTYGAAKSVTCPIVT